MGKIENEIAKVRTEHPCTRLRLLCMPICVTQMTTYMIIYYARIGVEKKILKFIVTRLITLIYGALLILSKDAIY